MVCVAADPVADNFRHNVCAAPLGILGATLANTLLGMQRDVYFQVAMLTTVGLTSKNAILIIAFATENLARGMELVEATMHAVRDRLRPILLTAVAAVMGAIPLVIFGGPGSASRATIGIVIVFGVSFSTLLSLFVVPAFYSLLARYTRSPEDLAHQLATLEATTPEAGGHA